MKAFIGIAMVVLSSLSARAELRTWTYQSGRTVEAEYVRQLFDDVILEDGAGNQIRIPVEQLSDRDRKYIELVNPPKLSVDFRQSFNQTHIKESPHLAKLPPSVLIYQFGARVKQTDTKPYSHPLKIEIYAFTQQRYDRDKYHLIAKLESKPFVLTDANKYKYEFMDPRTFTIIKYELDAGYIGWRETRGEKFAESMVLVRDEHGEVIAYNSSKKWLYEHLDKLESLPVGAWTDKTCTRVHPTSPKDTKSGEPLH